MFGRGRSALADPAFKRVIARSRVIGLAAGICVVAGAVIGGNGFISHLPGAWFFGTPGGLFGNISSLTKFPPVGSMVLVYGGLGAMALIWVHLCRVLFSTPGVPLSVVAKTAAIWAIPFIVAPPLFSRDVYSYVGQGALVALHINPYHYGTGVLGATTMSNLAGTLWASTPSPYGPTFLGVAGLIVAPLHAHVLACLVAMRVVALIGVVLVGWGVPHLARTNGIDPAGALCVAVASPLVLGTLIGGAHNDSLMIGLLVVGLVIFQRGHPVASLFVLGLATGVKAPAILGVALVGWNWAGREARVATRVKRTLVALGVAMGSLSAVTAIAGLGFGWVRALDAPSKIYTGVTPIQIVARLLGDLCHVVGISVSLPSLRSVCGVVGLCIAVVIGVVLLWRSPASNPVRNLGVALLVLALLSPVLWAWYLTWGVVVLAPSARGWLRRTLIALIALEALLGAGSVLSATRGLISAGAFASLMGCLGVVAGLLLAHVWLRDGERLLGIDPFVIVARREWRVRRLRRGARRDQDSEPAIVVG